MIISIYVQKTYEKNPTSFHDKNTQQTRNRIKLPPHEDGHLSN